MDWPLFGLRLSYRDVNLRPMREDDLPYLAAIRPPDVGHDPRLEVFPQLTDAQNGRRRFWQEYWRSYGTWSPGNWVLHFAVTDADELVGVQTLEGEDFPRLRTVDSASWLAPAARGHGVGTAMRTAVLGLAFDHLGASAAVSSATVGNAASLGVSRRIGYTDNGVSTIVETGGVARLQHLRLEAAAWRFRDQVTVTGLGPCLPWFGLAVPPPGG